MWIFLLSTVSGGNMNLKHEIETPISSLKMILTMLKEDGVLPERMEKNADASFERIKEILEKWKDENKLNKSQVKLEQF